MKRKKQIDYGQRATTKMDIIIGNRIRARRMEQHVSQSELGDMLGVSFQQVQKYEKGVNRVGSARLVQIAEALKCEIGYFLGDLNGKKATADVSEMALFMATRYGVQIVEAMMRLKNDDLRQSVIDLTRKLGNAVSA